MSWMTCTYSVLDRDHPLEMMFKAKGRNVLSALRVHGRPAPPGAGCGAPPGGGGAPQCKYTFTTSPSGSYRTEHVLDFLRQHLLKWTPERVARHDYRVLSLDAYRPHLSPDITKLAFERGYISHEGLMVPGGATGIVQGPDTDLHAWLEKELIGLQEASTSAKLSVRPGSTPSESRQSMVDYSIALWEMADHRQGVKSFKRNGLNNNLDGSEDKLITRSAREFWLELNMSAKRAICEIEVEQFLDALGREPHVGDVFQLLQPYSDDCGIGVAEEGEELQCALEAGEVDYVADDDGNHSVSSGLDDDDVPDDERPIDDLEKLTTDGVGKGEVAELPVSEGLGTGEVAELPVIKDIRIMDVLINLAWKMDNKSTLVSLEQQRERLQRQLRKGDIIDREAAADFCAEQRLALKDIQAVAKLEDQAKKLLKQSEQQKQRSLRCARNDHPPKLPEFVAAEPHALATALPLPAPLALLPADPPPLPPPPYEPGEPVAACDPPRKKNIWQRSSWGQMCSPSTSIRRQDSLWSCVGSRENGPISISDQLWCRLREAFGMRLHELGRAHCSPICHNISRN